MKTMLIIDDEDALRKCLTEIVSSKGWRVIEARNGSEAMTLIATNKIQVIVMSGGCKYSETEILKFGANLFIPKPLSDLSLVLERIDSLIA